MRRCIVFIIGDIFVFLYQSLYDILCLVLSFGFHHVFDEMFGLYFYKIHPMMGLGK